MKKTVRSICLIAVICMSISLLFTSCGKSTYEQFKTAFEKTDNLESIDMTMKMDLGMDTQGLSMEIPITLDMKGIQKDGKIEKMTEDMSMEFMGQKMNTSIYTDGKYIYTQSEDIKIKTPYDIDSEDIKKADVKFNSIVTEFKEEDLKDATVEKKDGITKVSFTVSGDAIKSTINSLSESLLGEMMATSQEGSDSGLEDITISDTKVSFSINSDEYIVNYSIDTNITTKIEETETDAKISLKLDLTVNNPGKEVKIDEPADLDEYVTEEEYMNSSDVYDDDTSSVPDFSEISEDAQIEIFNKLYDENGQKVENYDDELNKLIDKYGSTVPDFVEYMESI